MSFFDEGDEPPRRASGGGGGTATRPRLGGTASGSGGPGGRTPEEQQVFTRRIIAVVAGVVVVIILILLIQGCLSSQQEQALKDYNTKSGQLVQQSDLQGAKLFRVLSAGGNPQNLQVQVNALRGEAEQVASDAAKLDVPDEMKQAQQDLVLTLELRRDALTKIASLLPAALSKQASSSGPAIAQITGQNQAFLASDVVYSLRVAPLIAKALDDNDIGGQRIVQSRFLDDPLSWLDKNVVAQRLSGAGGSTNAASGKAAPGVHGHSLDSVTVGDTELSTDSPNRIPADPAPTFTVNYTNSGENDEKGVQVQIGITGAGAPINLSKTVDTSAGQSGSVDIPMTSVPPTGQPVTIKVVIKPVPGEKKTDNNTASYPAVFTK
jgi:hypothetical protein